MAKLEDYETVEGPLLGDIVRLKIDGEYWRVLQNCKTSVDSEGERLQRVISQYKVANSKGEEKYAAVAKFFGVVPGLGLHQEIILLSLEDCLEMSDIAQGIWADSRKADS